MIPEMPPQRNVKPQTGEKLYCLTGDRRAPADQPPGRFVADSPLEQEGFEPSVPRLGKLIFAPRARSDPRPSRVQTSGNRLCSTRSDSC
jgi:hypothetical protein